MSQESPRREAPASSPLDGTYEPTADVVVERVEDDLVLLDLQRNEVFGLNEVGAVLWEILASGRPAHDAVSAVTEAFEVDPETVTRDVGELLNVLVEKGLVRRR